MTEKIRRTADGPSVTPKPGRKRIMLNRPEPPTTWKDRLVKIAASEAYADLDVRLEGSTIEYAHTENTWSDVKRLDELLAEVEP
jgi:hypothetical protein